MTSGNGTARGALMRALTAGVVPALLALMMAVPVRVEAQGAGTQWKGCVDDALLDYNECLMEGGGWFSQKLCDIAFQIDVVVCSATVWGTVKEEAK